MRAPQPWLFLLALPACNDEEDLVCTTPSDLGSGAVEATIDGQAWNPVDGTWAEAGESLQVNTSATDGWMLSMVAYFDTAGTPILDALESAVLPIEVTLADGEQGGWALLYPDSGPSFASEAADGGLLTISAIEGDDLLGCLHFEASDEESTVALEEGRFRLAPRSF